MYCGTSNIVLPVKNKTFYPEAFRLSSRLFYYASLFNSVEINQTFYKLPMAKTLAKWRDDTPDSFRFTLKLGKEITHCREMDFDSSLLSRYMEVFSEIGHKKGCLLIQFPASVKANSQSALRSLLSAVDELNDGWKIAVEFRDISWYTGTVYSMLNDYHAAIVEHDMPASATPPSVPKQAWRYLRFHGIDGDYSGTYTDEMLTNYATTIRQAEAKRSDVYAYFNNTMGEAVQNALTLQQKTAVK